MFDPTFIKYPPAYDLNLEEIPPPPPPHKQTRTVKILLLILLVLALVIGTTTAWLYFKNDLSAIIPVSTYSAADLVKDFQAAHLKLWYVGYGKSINEWTYGAYSVPVAYTSSATFGDITECTGPCTPG